MATPKGVQGVSTPKNSLMSTPNRPVASPRPNSGAFANKTLAYKSPAGKTPTSFQGHTHRVSTSSHQISTPLAAPAIHDELLNLNSPAAALIASIGNTGLTPIASTQDALGITTGITPQAVRDVPLPARNPETEKLHRLEQVARLLKTKTAGRGITREGVERIAQIQGFTILWDEENLTIAGNSVDLEIVFDGTDRDTVRNVELRLNTSESEEPQLQKDASNVLKEHLTVSTDTKSTEEAWKSLRNFSRDLEYLSQLDYTESSVNCFELVGGLYSAFQKIWDEEKKRVRDRSETDHICQGNVGRPLMHGHGRLGITTQFWVDKSSYKTATNETEAEAEAPHQSSWLAHFSCEKGSPGIVVDGDWLESEPLSTTVTTEDVFQESQTEKPNWSSTNASKNIEDQQKDPDTIMLEGAEITGPSHLNLVFTCHFNTAVLLPINAVSGLNGQYQMVQIEQDKVFTYQQVLLNESVTTPAQEWNPGVRWPRTVDFFDNAGEFSGRQLSFSLFASGVPWTYPVSEFRFTHPKQYADALPVLRQYALLWSILRNTLVNDAATEASNTGLTRPGNDPKHAKKPKTKKRSNKTFAQETLEDLLSPKSSETTVPKIDLSLDIMTDPSKAKIEVIIPLPDRRGRTQESPFVHVTIEICRNALVEIPILRGLPSTEDEKMRRKATRVLVLSEDISVLVLWLLDFVTQKK